MQSGKNYGKIQQIKMHKYISLPEKTITFVWNWLHATTMKGLDDEASKILCYGLNFWKGLNKVVDNILKPRCSWELLLSQHWDS